MGRTTKRAVTREEPESHCHAPRKWVESTLVRKSAPVVNNPPTSCSFSCHGSVEKSGEDRSSHSFDGQPTMSVEPNLDIDGFKDHEEFFAALEKHKYAQMEVNQQNPTIAEKTTRRQGSGRRRPVKYRHLPSNGASSQQILIDNVPILNLESILDIEDPEEFFSALEKQENAERERRKQMGIVSLDLYPQSPSRTARSRRPKTWKSVKNKYSYSNVVSSQETLVENVPGPSDCGVQHETTNPDVSSEQKEISHDELQETELDGSIRVSRLLDKLLPKNGEELDKNEAITLIKEHVQFEPIDVGKSCFPELEDVPRIDFRALEAKLPKPRNSLSEDKQNMLNLHGIRTQIQKKHSQAESSVPSSPTPPRNPMDSIISLKKLQSDPKKRCFSFSELDIDQSPPRNASPFESVTKQTEEVNMEKDLTIPFKISSPVIEENDTAHVNMSLPGVAIGLTSSSDETGKDNFNRLGSGIDVGSSGFHVDFKDNFGGSDMDNMVLDEVVGRLDADTEVQTNEPNEADKMEDIQQEAVEPDLNMEDSNVENLNSTQSHLDQSAVVEEHVMDGPSNTAGTGPEQHKEEPQTPTRVSSILESEKISRKRRKGNDEGTRVLQNEPSETRSRPQKKGCGTSRDTAMRRSTRVKWKPLKFWEGEKLISARIIGSETLTVVGRIYLSPSEDTGSPTLTVESLVSDEYKDLVEDAARH